MPPSLYFSGWFSVGCGILYHFKTMEGPSSRSPYAPPKTDPAGDLGGIAPCLRCEYE